MKLLAFDTSTDSLSIAVGRLGDSGGQGGPRVWPYTGVGGPVASSQLIPQVMALLAQAGLQLRELDAVVFGCGPGSFTGLRTACAVAQGLAFGGGVPVLPVDTLLAVAEEARHLTGATQIHAVLDARMDQIYMADYVFDEAGWTQHGDFSVLTPEALPVRAGWALAGNAFAAYDQRLPIVGAQALRRINALPTATALLRLAPALLAAGRAVPPEQALPRYIRDKVAKTTDERAAERAAALHPAP